MYIKGGVCENRPLCHTYLNIYSIVYLKASEMQFLYIYRARVSTMMIRTYNKENK
jgi:hypothetical protein